MIFFGIDNGKSGAIVGVNEYDKVEVYTVMPVIQGKRKEYDVVAIKDFFKTVNGSGNRATAVIEKVQVIPKNGSMSALSMGQCYGIMQGLLSAYNIPYEIVSPRTWQKALLVGLSKDTKLASIKYTKQKQPSWDLTPTERSKKPHDGLADAYCLAVYCRKQYINTKPLGKLPQGNTHINTSAEGKLQRRPYTPGIIPDIGKLLP